MFKFLKKIIKYLFKKEPKESLFWKEYCDTIKRKEYNMYRIIDRQGMGTMESRVFETKADIVEALAGYHSVDFSGCLEDDDERSIYEYLEQFKTTQEKLDYLLDYGEWEIEIISKLKI